MARIPKRDLAEKRRTRAKRYNAYRIAFGKRLRALRMKRHYTQTLLGEMIGVRKTKIWYYEVGQLLPMRKQILLLAAALGVEFEALCPKPLKSSRYKKRVKPRKPRQVPLINGREAHGWERRDHIVPPEPPPDAKEFGWRSRLENIPTRSERLRAKSREEDAAADDPSKKTS